LLLALVACQSPEEKAKARLQQQVAAVREAAEAADAEAAAERLATLRADVAKMHQENLITEQDAQQILTAALQVQAGLAFIASEAPPPSAPPPPPAPAPAQLEPPSSNRGGSIRGADGQPGEKGKKGAPGRGANNSDDDDDD